MSEINIKKNTHEEMAAAIGIAICRHFPKRTDYVFGFNNVLYRVEECSGHFKFWNGRNDYKYCSDINDVLKHLDSLFNGDEDE